MADLTVMFQPSAVIADFLAPPLADGAGQDKERQTNLQYDGDWEYKKVFFKVRYGLGRVCSLQK